MQALARSMPALALTDTNGLYGLVWFLQYAAERGLRPIVGAELRTEESRAVLLARNREGMPSSASPFPPPPRAGIPDRAGPARRSPEPVHPE